MDEIDWKFYGVGHQQHLLCNPTSAARLDRLLGLLQLPAGAEVTDVACGKAELLCRLAERFGIRGTGVDLSPWEVPAARQRVAARGLEDRLTIVAGDGAEHVVEPASQALASCLGASWIWQGHRGTLSALIAWTQPGGYVLVGEPFFVGEPPAEYLEHAGLTREVFGSHASNVATGVELGLRPVYTMVSTLDEWDHYEWLQQTAFDRYALESPDDPDLPELERRFARAREEYLRWGRDHLAWALYLFRKP